MSGILLSLLALLMGAVYISQDPAQSFPQPHLRDLSLALLSVLAWWLACLGAGGALLSRLSPALLSEEDSGLYALCTGLLLWGLLLCGVSLSIGLGSAGIILTAALLGSGWLLRPTIRWPSMPPGALAACGVLLLVGLIDASAPPIDTDELYYHLALPAEMLQTGGLVGGPLRPDGSRPMLLHLPYAALLSSGGPSAPRLFHLSLSLALLSGLVSLSRRHLGNSTIGTWACWLLVGSWSVTQGVGLAANNLPTALAVLLTLDCALRGERRVLPLLAGLALSIKYTAAGAIAGIWLVAQLPWRVRIWTGVAALAVVSPWWLINAGRGLHPLFPFAGWPGDMPFQYLEKYGYGRTLPDLLLLPYRAVMHAEINSFHLLGRISPGFAALLPAAVLASWRSPMVRRLWVVSGVSLLMWAMGPHWLRYLLPALPLIALTLAAGLSTSRGVLPVAVALVIGLGLPSNWGPLLAPLADRLPAAIGQESREAYLSRTEETWATMQWSNTHLPEDARVAILYAWTGYFLERPVVLSSVEDHIPVRHWLMMHGTASLSALKDQGVSHLIVGQTMPIQNAYPFLSDEEFVRGFAEPSMLLEELLLQEAILLFEENRLRVYRLR